MRPARLEPVHSGASSSSLGLASPHLDSLLSDGDGLTPDERLAREMQAQQQRARVDEEEQFEHSQQQQPHYGVKRGFQDESEPQSKRGRVDTSHAHSFHRSNEVLSHQQHDSAPFVDAPAFAAASTSHSHVAASAASDLSHGGGFKRHVPRARGSHHGGAHNGDEEEGEQYSVASPGMGKRNNANAGKWIQLLPVRYGWSKLLLYALFAAGFLFLFAHWLNEVVITHANTNAAAAAAAAAGLPEQDSTIVFSAATDADAAAPPATPIAPPPVVDDAAIVYKSIHKSPVQQQQAQQAQGKSGESSIMLDRVKTTLPSDPTTTTTTPITPAMVAPASIPASPATPAAPLGEEPTPAHTMAELPPVSRESLVAELGNAFAEKKNAPTPATVVATTPVAATPVVAVPVAVPVAPVVVAPTPAPVAVVAPKVETHAAVVESKPAAESKKHGKASAVSEAAKKKSAEGDKKKQTKKSDKESKSKDGKSKDSSKKDKKSDKKKPKVAAGPPPISAAELAALRSAAAVAAAAPAVSAATWTAPAADPTYILGPDIVVVVATKSNHHELLSRASKLWGSKVANLVVYSNAASTVEGGLKTQVLTMPHPDWKPHDSRYHSWRVPVILQHLHETQHEVGAAGTPREKFFLFVDDVTFPLLDRIRTKLDNYRTAHGGAYPMFAGGPLSQINFFKSYWSQQQSRAYNLFKSNKLQSAPTMLFGFSSAYLDYVGEFLRPDACPTLFGDDLALAGLTACAGGVLPSRFMFDFFALEKKNPTEAGVAGADIDSWQKADAYHGVDTVDALEKTWTEYQQKAGIKAAAN